MKNISLSLLCFFTLLLTSAQTGSLTTLQEYLTPSPEAQEFIKYGEYPVGMYTGVPEISIPLYDIRVKEIELPISVSYHASGIQVDQIASWVGLGWSLNTGGMISKIPRGIPDDAGKGFLMSTIPEFNALVFDHDFYEDSATGRQDTESDIYYYNFAGYSGKFFFDRSKEIRLIDQAPIDITYSLGKFKITTKEGTTYEFNDIESTQSKTYSLGNPLGAGTEQNYVSSWHLSKITSKNKIDSITYIYEAGYPFTSNQYNYSESTGNDVDDSTCPPSIIANVHSGGGSEIASQTQITQNPKRIAGIIFPNGKIVFDRLADRQDIALDRLTEVEIFQKNNLSYNLIKSYGFFHDYYYSSQSQVYPSNPIDARRYRLKLTELHEFDKNGLVPKKHIFTYDNTMLPPIETNGKDFWGYYNGKNSNTSLVPLQSFQYLNNNVGSADRNPDSTFTKAGILTKITYPTGGYTEFHYEPHQYITTEATLISKNKSAFAVGLQNVIGNGVYLEETKVFTPNYSGYATITIEASDRSSGSGVYPKVTLQRAGSPGYLINHSIDPTTYSYPLNPPIVNITFQPVWLDKGIAYTLKAEAEGTSNSNEFDGAAYMKAEIDYKEESATSTQVTKLAGGLRINQIKSFSKNNELAFSKKYQYSNERLITPEVFIKEQYLETEIEKWRYCSIPGESPSCLGNSTTRRFYYGGTVQNLTLNGGSSVVYGSVDEIAVDGSNNSLGKTNYTFTFQADDILPAPSSYNGGIMLLKKDWMGGQNISKSTYAEGAATYNTNEINGYTLKKYDESYKMYKIVHSKRISGNCTNVNNSADTGNRFLVFEYPIFTGAKLLNSTIRKTKDADGNEISESTTIFYDNETHLQPTRTETIMSNGNTVSKKIFYPDDITNSASLGSPDLESPEKTALDMLNVDNLHQVATPVQIKTTVKDSNGIVLSTTTERILYKDFGSDLILPESVKSLKGTYLALTNQMEDRMDYVEYDSHGNPLQVSYADGPQISYIWGYEGKYAIAKIENASYSEIASELGITVNDLKGYDETNITAINGLRDSLSNAMITTYTYAPLIGVASITNPRGYTINYEYDDHNRLKEVRDADNNLVTDYEYHIKGQN